MSIQNKIKTAFTLIEILVVLFIIGIIFAITLPTFGPMMRTTRVKTASETLANVMEMARQHAKTMSTDCYMVFPSSTTETDLNNRAFKVYNPTTNTTVGKMEILPTGIVVDISNSLCQT